MEGVAFPCSYAVAEGPSPRIKHAFCSKCQWRASRYLSLHSFLSQSCNMKPNMSLNAAQTCAGKVAALFDSQGHYPELDEMMQSARSTCPQCRALSSALAVLIEQVQKHSTPDCSMIGLALPRQHQHKRMGPSRTTCEVRPARGCITQSNSRFSPLPVCQKRPSQWRPHTSRRQPGERCQRHE